MMMSKPSETEDAAPQIAPPAPLNKSSAADSVKDLERRLQMMSAAESKPAPPPVPPAAAKAPPPAAPPAAAGAGKNALLVSRFGVPPVVFVRFGSKNEVVNAFSFVLSNKLFTFTFRFAAYSF